MVFVVFLLLFSSVASASLVGEIKDCIRGPDKNVGETKVKNFCDSKKADVKKATGDMKSKIEEANAATGEIDEYLKEYNGICDEIPVDELETKIDEIDGKIDSETGPIATEINNKYRNDIKPKMVETEGKIESMIGEFDKLCEEDMVQNADKVYTALDSDLTDMEVWVNGLPNDAESIIGKNGGDDATYQKFKRGYDKIQGVYKKLGKIIELYGRIGELCKRVMKEIGGALEELKTSFAELDTLCKQINDFIENEVIKPIEDILGGIDFSESIDKKLTALCEKMTESIKNHIVESDWNGFLCKLLQKLIDQLNEAAKLLDVFMDFWNEMQKYRQCVHCLNSQIDKLETGQKASETRASKTCSDTTYNEAKAMYAKMWNNEKEKESKDYLFAIYKDPELKTDDATKEPIKKASVNKDKFDRRKAVAYLDFDPSRIAEAEGCVGDKQSSKIYKWGSKTLNKVSDEAATMRLILYSVLAKKLLKVAGAGVGLLKKLTGVTKILGHIPYIGYMSSLSKMIPFATKVLDVFMDVFTALTGTCHKIAAAEEKMNELTVPNKEVGKLDKQYGGTTYVKLPVLQGAIQKEGDTTGGIMDPNWQEMGLSYYGLTSSMELEGRSPEDYGRVKVSQYMEPFYSSNSGYVSFIEDWNKQIGYDVTDIIKEMPITATTGPVHIDLDETPDADQFVMNDPKPICTVTGLFRTEKSKKNEAWSPLSMPYKDHEVMWTKIFGITPDIEMRNPDCNILIYNFGSGEKDKYDDLMEILEKDNYEVEYHERVGEDITPEMLSNYCQVWFIDGGEASITSDEIIAIGDYINKRGNVLLTAGSESFSNVQQIAEKFGVSITTSENTATLNGGSSVTETSDYTPLYDIHYQESYYCSDKPEINGVAGESDQYPCKLRQDGRKYRYTLHPTGFKNIYNPNDPRLVCGVDYDDLASCLDENKKAGFPDGKAGFMFYLTSLQRPLTPPDIDSFPEKFRLFIPPGTVYAGVTLYFPINGKEGIVDRYKKPPDCSYCQHGHPPDEYSKIPWETAPIRLSDLTERDIYRPNNGGSAMPLPAFSRTSPMSSEESGWLYIKKLPFGSSTIHDAKMVFQLNIKAYLDWYNKVKSCSDPDQDPSVGYCWNAEGDPVRISSTQTQISQNSGGDCDVPMTAGCISPSFIPHEITNGVTSISQHAVSITNTDFKEICTSSSLPCTIFSDDDGGKLVIDSSSERFSRINDCENSRYVRNIARFFSLERWTKTGNIKIYVGGGCTRYHEGTNIENYHLYCENPLTLIEDVWSPYPLCSWLMHGTVCWKGGNNRGETGWYHGPIEDQVEVKVRYKDSNGDEQEKVYLKKGKPHTDEEDTINSYFVVDATLPEEARSLNIEANYSCKTRLDRQVYHVTCKKKCGTDFAPYIIPCCPFWLCTLEGKNKGCKQANTESIIDTSSLTDRWSEIDSWMNGDTLVRDGLLSTLDAEVSGSIKPNGDGGWVADLTLKPKPDIISGFVMTIGDHSMIYHQERFYPVKHEMFRRFSAKGVEKKEYNIIDRYGYDSPEHGYLQQCKETCPPLECECPTFITEPICWDPSSEKGYSVRKDCVCVPRDGQKNPCVSDRTFHEDDGVYYDFVRLSAYDTNEMAMMGYAPQKTLAVGLVNEGEISKEDGVYKLHFTTGTTTDSATGETIQVTEDDLRNAELTLFTPFETTPTRTLSEWMAKTTTSVPTTSIVTTSLPTTTAPATTTIHDTCTPACSTNPDYEACDDTYYAYCRASCNSGEETPPGGVGNDWCQSKTAKDLGVSDDGYVCCCCCVGGTCS